MTMAETGMLTPTIYIGVPPRKMAEAVAAIYGLVMGCYGLAAYMDGGNAFAWVPGSSWNVPALFMAGSLVHGAGVKINGRWRWSPVLRLIGISLHTLIIGALVLAAMPLWSSAAPNYAFVLFLFIVAMTAAARDAIRAIRGGAMNWSL